MFLAFQRAGSDAVVVGAGRNSQRQTYGKRSALFRARTLDLDPAVVHIDQMSHDRQSQSQAPLRARSRSIRLPEPIENVRQKLRADANASVRDLDAYF